jgi:hypothetical protein
MSYYISVRKRIDGTFTWHVKRDEWSDGKKKPVHIPADQLVQHGFQPDMSVEQAKARASQINASARLDKQEQKKKFAALKNYKRLQLIDSVFLPKILIQEFEEDYLKREMDFGPNGPVKYRKALSTWAYVQKMVTAIALPKEQWWKQRRSFYGYFAKQETAPDYAQKVLRILNLWGDFQFEKQGGSFRPVPSPRGNEREMIADAFQESDKLKKKTSVPITPEMLEAARGKFSEAQYRWLYLSVWLGLRPKEVDGTKKALITKESGFDAIRIYQSKLKNVPKEDRYKLIHFMQPEQLACLKMLKQEVDRPLVKTVQKFIHNDANLYGGRKGFVDLMLSRDQDLENIRQWMGHSEKSRVMDAYKQRNKFHFKKTG